MKLTYSQTRKRDAEAYKKYLYLWKTDDPEWVSNRKLAWRKMVETEGLSPLLAKLWGAFYVFGEECPSYIEDEESGELESIQFEFKHRIAFMPFESVEQAREFFEYAQENRGVRNHMHSEAQFVGGALLSLPERDYMVKLVTEALFCEKYFIEDKNVRDRKRKTIKPLDFIVGYSRVNFMFQDMDKYQWDYRVFSFDYFMLNVKYCEERELFSDSSRQALKDMYIDLMKQDDEPLNSYRKDLKYKLIGAAEGEDAVDTLKDALSAARAELNQ